MKKILSITSITWIFFSCTKEKTTNYSAFLKNGTSHQIVIKGYTNGSVFQNDIIQLAPGETKQIANGTDRGIVENGGFTPYHFQTSDSLRVTFDNQYTLTHYFKTPSSLYPKHYLYSSLRNIGNYQSYVLQSRDLSKFKRENVYNYEFSEQDYLDAK